MFTLAQDTLQLQGTARMITSKPVQRAVVNTVLLVSSALTLLGLASIATALFFQNHVPHQLLSTSVHLQYGYAAGPTIRPSHLYTFALTVRCV